jgi:hypothetical protein
MKVEQKLAFVARKKSGKKNHGIDYTHIGNCMEKQDGKMGL